MAIEQTERPSKEGGVQVITRAISILRALRNHPEGLSLAQIAKEVNLARSTVHRIVSTLEDDQFVTAASASGGYRLGPALAVLGAAVNHNLRDQLRPFLEQLFLEINETIDLAVLEGDQLVFVDQIATPHRLRAVSGVGLSFPLHCTANGKAMLAKLDQEQMERLLPDVLPSFTPNTETSQLKLEQELAQIREAGIAFDREEHTLGICAIGAAFWDPLGTLAAISIPVPSIRFYGNEQLLVEALLRNCEKIKAYLAAI